MPRTRFNTTLAAIGNSPKLALGHIIQIPSLSRFYNMRTEMGFFEQFDSVCFGILGFWGSTVFFSNEFVEGIESKDLGKVWVDGF